MKPATPTPAPARAQIPPAALRDLRRIPGVGPSLATDLYLLGIRSVKGLKRRDPEHLYTAHCRQAGQQVDRCVLYVFREAVYFSKTARPDPELLKWWNWKDPKPGAVRRPTSAP